jgi:4-carboxymuconolactone decarboxylase
MGPSSTSSRRIAPDERVPRRRSRPTADRTVLAGTRGRRSLLLFAAAMSRRDSVAAARALASARSAGLPRRALEEAGLMLVLHAGYPAALEALGVLNRCWPGEAAPLAEGGLARWRRNGERLCRKVYGESYPRLVENVRRLHPDLAVWMIEQGYGRVLSRPRLGARDRELVAVAVLAAGGWERQLVSHLLGALRMGCDPESIRLATRCGSRFADARGRAAAARALRGMSRR